MQDTLKSPPPENKTMKRASMVAIFVTTFFYLCCGCFGYAAFGNDTPGNLLTGFGFYEPYWLIDFANACIVLHLVGGYQVLPINIEFKNSKSITYFLIGLVNILFMPKCSRHFYWQKVILAYATNLFFKESFLSNKHFPGVAKGIKAYATIFFFFLI